MKNHRTSPGKLCSNKLHRGRITFSRTALRVLCLAEVFPTVAESGKLLGRSELASSTVSANCLIHRAGIVGRHPSKE
jgi:hypothetical protein